MSAIDIEAELEIEREISASAEPPKKPRKVDAEEENEALDDGNKDGKREEEAMEDNEEPEVDGDSREPSDAEDEDNAPTRTSEEEEESESEDEATKKKLTKKQQMKEKARLMAKSFMDDIAADESEDEKMVKRLKKKSKSIKDLEEEEDADPDLDQYEKATDIDDEDEIHYETDFEKELRRKKKKKEAAKKKKAEGKDKKKRKRQAQSSSESESEESEQSEEEESEASETEEPETKKPKKKAKKTDLTDDEMINMTTLGTESIEGVAERAKAGFHEYADSNGKSAPAAAAAAATTTVSKKAPSEAAAKGSRSPAKKPSSAKPRAPKKKKNTYPVGEVFTIGKKQTYQISWRGKDTKMEMKVETGKYGFAGTDYHPDQWTTAELVKANDKGTWIGQGEFLHFLTSQDRKPTKVSANYVVSAWKNRFCAPAVQTEFANLALRHNNFVVNDEGTTKRMVFLPELYEIIRKEAVVVGGVRTWSSPFLEGDLQTQTIDLNGNLYSNSTVKEKALAAAANGKSPKKAAAASAPVKPKIKPDANSHDVAKMFSKAEKKQSAAAAVAAAAPIVVVEEKKDELDDLFAPSPKAVDKIEEALLFNNEKVHDFFEEMLVLQLSKKSAAEANKSYRDLAERMNKCLAKGMSLSEKHAAVKKEFQGDNAVHFTLFYLPFLAASAAKIVRQKMGQ